jgi:hypothetical protein
VSSEHSFRIEDSKEGNVLLGADEARIEKGEIYHTVVLLWGKLDIYGEVDEVVVLSGHVTFHDSSKLNKSLVVMGGTFESQPGAKVAAENVVAKLPGPFWRMLRSAGNVWRENIDWVAKLLAGLVTCLFFWLSGWALFHGFPGLQKNTEGTLAKDWAKNLVVGLLGSMGACMVFVMLLISIIGIVIIPLYFLFLVGAALVSYLAAALWAGHRLLPPKPGTKLNPWGFLLGILVLQFLWVVPVGWASLPVFLLWTLAWGALLRSMRLLWK